MKFAKTAIWAACAVFLALTDACASVLAIENRTDQEIINIFVKSEDAAREFFLRLDLLPGASDSVENPDCVASLRLDTGLAFVRFQAVDLAKAGKLIFQGDQCLVLDSGGSELAAHSGQIEQLEPQPGDKPVCSLDQFRPHMTMAEVCEILPGEMPHDDNGALMAGLGFAGLTWAARLVPEAVGPVSGNSLLDHLALRRPLELPDLSALLRVLLRQGYVPWQAEFPGLEVNLAAEPGARSDSEVMELAQAFIKASQKGGHGNHANGEKCAEASIIMAPRSRLGELENADQPAGDVQIYTIYLQPCTNTLLLDLAAYRK